MTPATEAVMQVAIAPPSIALTPSWESRVRRFGAMEPRPPIWMATEPKFAKPQSA
jgi:hypothetical protein